MSQEVRTRDFSRRHRQLEFTADGETHIALPALPPESVQEMMQLMKHPEFKTDMTVMMGIFDIVMVPVEAEKIKARMTKSHPNPLGFVQIVDIIEWLTEEFTQRPTKPSGSSSSGSQAEMDEAGTSSMAGAPAEESTLSS